MADNESQHRELQEATMAERKDLAETLKNEKSPNAFQNKRKRSLSDDKTDNKKKAKHSRGTKASRDSNSDKGKKGQTPADSVSSSSKPFWDKPRRKLFGKKKGFLRGLTIENLPFRPDDEVPLFVNNCVAIIEGKGLTMEGIYRKPGKKADVEEIITNIDKDPNFDITHVSMSVHLVASSFKQYFHVLSGPFVAYKIQTDLIKKFNDMQKEDFLIHLKSIVDNLSRRRYNLLKYVLLHLKRIIYHSDENKMNAKNVSICWWPCLLHPQSTDLSNVATLESIFTVLLENVEMILELEVETAEEAMAGEVNEECE